MGGCKGWVTVSSLGRCEATGQCGGGVIFTRHAAFRAVCVGCNVWLCLVATFGCQSRPRADVGLPLYLSPCVRPSILGNLDIV